MDTPSHYQPTGVGPTPWDLQKTMQTSGSCFVDARRTDAIEYCYRVKDDMLGDLRKARHCIEEAIAEMEAIAADQRKAKEAWEVALKALNTITVAEWIEGGMLSAGQWVTKAQKP